MCVPAGDLLVESCRWGLCEPVPAGDLLVKSCRWDLCVCPCWRLASRVL